MDNRIAGASIPGGTPVSAVTQAFAQLGSERLAVLSFSEDQVLSIGKTHGVWTRHAIPPHTCPGQADTLFTISQPNFLACRADLPDDVVYSITRTIFENQSYLVDIHQAAAALSLEGALSGLAVPLHPGAVRFFEQRGLSIPSSLRPPVKREP